MKRTFLMAGAVVALPLLTTSAIASPYQATQPALAAYARAIDADIRPWWETASYDGALRPGSRCTVLILQMPGGDVLSVDFSTDCEFGKAGRAALADAVHHASPLPYIGFESVFQRKISLTFHAASADARKDLLATRAATTRVRRESAEADRKWDATVGTKMRQDEYKRQCSFHLLWEMPKVRLSHRTAVIITVDRAGNVIRVTGSRQEPVDERLFAAFQATPPCPPVPPDLALESDTVKIGPVFVGGPNS